MVSWIIPFHFQVWEGPIGPKSPDQMWPIARGVHGTACMVDPQSEDAAMHQQMMVFWGEGNNAIHLSDIWILHVPSMTWKEVDTLAIIIPTFFLLFRTPLLFHYGQFAVMVQQHFALLCT